MFSSINPIVAKVDAMSYETMQNYFNLLKHIFVWDNKRHFSMKTFLSKKERDNFNYNFLPKIPTSLTFYFTF